MMKKRMMIPLAALMLTACAGDDAEEQPEETAQETEQPEQNDETDPNDHQDQDEETTGDPTQSASVEQYVQEQREAYTAELEEISFTGDPDDLMGVILEPATNSPGISVGVPLSYQFVEEDGQQQLTVHIVEQSEGDSDGPNHQFYTHDIQDIRVEEDTYIVETEGETFYFEMFTESDSRLRSEDGELLIPSHYVPSELISEWQEEAEEAGG
jgi:hypothetical protein